MSNFECAARFKTMIKERISNKFEEKNTNPVVMLMKLNNADFDNLLIHTIKIGLILYPFCDKFTKKS